MERDQHTDDTAAGQAEPFTDISRPASTITELVDHLSNMDTGSYVYRGQTRIFPGPLLPSAFRGVLGEKPIISGGEATSRSLRGIGTRFIGNYVWDREDYHRRVSAAIQDKRPSTSVPQPNTVGARDAAAYRESHFTRVGEEWVEHLAFDPLDVLIAATCQTNEFNSLVASVGCEAAIRRLSERYLPPIAANRDRLQTLLAYVNERHRYEVHTGLFIGAFSYVLGSLISQQYGFHSGLLDATTNVNIAAFFATHEGPEYSLVKPDGSSKIGVIYRFLRDTTRASRSSATANAYGRHGSLVVHQLLRELEGGVTPSESLNSIRACFELRHLPNHWKRAYDLLKIPAGVVTTSRIGRQEAAVVIPDQIEVLLSNAYLVAARGAQPVVHPNNRVQMSIEDLNYRLGVRRFYFVHSSVEPCPDITPSYLWPNNTDFFLLCIAYLLVSGFSCYLPNQSYVCPLRMDLIDPGSGGVDEQRLLAEARSVVAAECPLNREEFGAAPQLSGDARQFYLVYKTAVLLREGSIVGDRSRLLLALDSCRWARESHPNNPTLGALELIAVDALGRRKEFERTLIAHALSVARRVGPRASSPLQDRHRSLSGMLLQPQFVAGAVAAYVEDEKHSKVERTSLMPWGIIGDFCRRLWGRTALPKQARRDLSGLRTIALNCPLCRNVSDMLVGDRRCPFYLQRDDVGVLMAAECPYCKNGMLVCIKQGVLRGIEPFDTPMALQAGIEKFAGVRASGGTGI